MSDLFEQSLIARIAQAKELKVGKNKLRINENLISLQTWLLEIQTLKNEIKDEKSYNKFNNHVKTLLNSTIEKITAPNVEDFISWVTEITKINNSSNLSKLKEYLVKNYSDSINNQLEVILLNKIILEGEESIFNKLLKSAKSSISKTINKNIEKPEEIANNIDGLLTTISSQLEALSKIEELNFTSINQLYNDALIENNIDWYNSITSLILDKNQSLIASDDDDKTKDLLQKIQKRISDIKECIIILNECDIANQSDETLKNIFFKFKDDMVKYEGGIKNKLEEFIEQWTEIEQSYSNIKLLFDEKMDIDYKLEWDSFINGAIKPIVLEYSEILKVNPLQNILTYKPQGIKSALTSKNKTISEFKVKCDLLKSQIYIEFERLKKEYDEKNIPLLNNLAKNNEPLQLKIGSINLQLEGLNNGIVELQKVENILTYLVDSFNYDLNCSKDITNLFTKALQESGKSEHLKWLQLKLNGSDPGSLTEDDFKNPELIKELLSIGLIKINIEKQF